MSDYVYPNSNNVYVFPTTKREANKGLFDHRTSRLLTEKNLVDIVNKLVDRDAFVITKNFVLNDNNILEFNIKGYLFSVKGLESIVTSLFESINDQQSEDLELWANIFINKVGDYEELYGIDENNSYTGLIFCDSSIHNAQGSLKILEKPANSAWRIPKDSLVKFDMNSLPNPLDCGLID